MPLTKLQGSVYHQSKTCLHYASLCNVRRQIAYTFTGLPWLIEKWWQGEWVACINILLRGRSRIVTNESDYFDTNNTRLAIWIQNINPFGCHIVMIFTIMLKVRTDLVGTEWNKTKWKCASYKLQEPTNRQHISAYNNSLREHVGAWV